MKTRLILLCAALLLAVSAYAENPVSLPANLTVIEEEAFEGLNVGTVVLPEGTTTIGSRAFADCAELTIVHMPDSVESIQITHSRAVKIWPSFVHLRMSQLCMQQNMVSLM